MGREARQVPSGGRVVSYEQAYSAALRAFLHDGQLDMDALADTLAVSRARPR